VKRILLACLWLYRGLISPLLPTSCRYYPTCSAYSHEAIERYGARIGLLMTVRRLARCHPWAQGGFDPVP
jgi:putative membrane protein insertion efficiency factor